MKNKKGEINETILAIPLPHEPSITTNGVTWTADSNLCGNDTFFIELEKMNLIDQSLAELIKENERLIKQLRIYSEGLDRIQKGVATHHKEFDDGGSWVSKIYSEIKKKIKEIG